MKSLIRNLVVGTALIAMTAGAAYAHRAWILPSATVFSKEGSIVTIDAAASNTLFFPDHRPMGVDQIKVYAPDGSVVTPVNSVVGSTRTTFDVKLDKPGTYRIANASSGGGGRGGGPGGGAGGMQQAGGPGGQAQGGQNRPAPAAILGDPSGPIMAEWTEGAETKRWRGTIAQVAADGIDKKKGVQLSTQNRRVETFVTVGKPTPIPQTGKGLELAGGTHPNDLYADEEVSLKFADNGKPAANLELELISGGDRYRDKENVIKVKTDKDGVAKLKFPEAGMYWLSGEADTTATIEGKPVKSRSTYVAVLEVLPG